MPLVRVRVSVRVRVMVRVRVRVRVKVKVRGRGRGRVKVRLRLRLRLRLRVRVRVRGWNIALADAIGCHACALEVTIRVTNSIATGAQLLTRGCCRSCCNTRRPYADPHPCLLTMHSGTRR
jgi:hypothetical protein